MSAHRHQTYKPGCFRCDLGLDEEGGHVVAIHRDDLRALLAPAIDADDEALVEKVARAVAEADYMLAEHANPGTTAWEAAPYLRAEWTMIARAALKAVSHD